MHCIFRLFVWSNYVGGTYIMHLCHSHILFACHEYQMHCGPGLAQASTSTMPCSNTHMHVACTYTIRNNGSCSSCSLQDKTIVVVMYRHLVS